MTTIYKYVLPINDEPMILMPKGANILSVQTQHGEPHIWVEVNPDAPVIERYFCLRGTGHSLRGNEGRFVGTFLVRDDDLVFHLYEQRYGKP
jgi:hypothetical protein